ncbi:hypothetical protein CYY_000903 [Polysphondylium violaceum]|uniref:SHSP domain-containing protein n=1 Tax=Polysphondylium violaceum TaxID=133409 RepID=A0A8J4Q2W9_9MYCE|nr:hypothetical protein CYY_000903 [Polysphondylium violaceum]
MPLNNNNSCKNLNIFESVHVNTLKVIINHFTERKERVDEFIISKHFLEYFTDGFDEVQVVKRILSILKYDNRKIENCIHNVDQVLIDKFMKKENSLFSKYPIQQQLFINSLMESNSPPLLVPHSPIPINGDITPTSTTTSTKPNNNELGKKRNSVDSLNEDYHSMSVSSCSSSQEFSACLLNSQRSLKRFKISETDEMIEEGNKESLNSLEFIYPPQNTFDISSVEDKKDYDSCAPPINIIEIPMALLIEVEMVGIRKEDIEIEIMDGILLVSGKRNSKILDRIQKLNNISYPNTLLSKHDIKELKSEITYGFFKRVFVLSNLSILDLDNVECSHRDGLLTIIIKKKINQQFQI